MKCVAGYRSGRLLAESRVPSKNKRSRWLCSCECGNKKEVDAKHLISKAIRSCGCLLKEVARSRFLEREPIDALKRQMYLTYISSAKVRGIPMDITEDQFHEIASGDCDYCGSPPSEFKSRLRVEHAPYLANGIDRVDSSVGYVIGNVVPCCKNCNIAKNAMSREVFIKMCEMVTRHCAGKVS